MNFKITKIVETIPFQYNSITVFDKEIAEGAQGKVFLTIDQNFAVKIFNQDSTQNCLNTLVPLIKKLKDSFKPPKNLLSHPCLHAFPICVFECNIQNEKKFGTISKYLKNWKTLLDQNAWIRIASLEKSQKYELFHNIASCFYLFSTIGYVYVDLSWSNILTSPTNPPQIALLDFESGGLLHEPNSTTSTIGKKEGFEAPEIFLKNNTNRINIYSDWWSMAVLFFIILSAGFHPFFFLKDLGNISKYVNETQWPNYNINYWKNGTDQDHDIFKNIIKDIEPEILNLFIKTFNSINNPYERTSPYVWLTTIETILKKSYTELPTFTHHDIKKTQIGNKKYTLIEWETKNANYVKVQLNEKSILKLPNDKIIIPDEIKEVKLIAIKSKDNFNTLKIKI